MAVSQVIPPESTAGGGGGGASITMDQTVAQLVAAEGTATVGDMAIPSDAPDARFACLTAGTWTVTVQDYSFPASALADTADFTVTLDGSVHAGTPTDNFVNTALGLTWRCGTTSLYNRMKLQALPVTTDWRARALIAPAVTDFNYNATYFQVWDNSGLTGYSWVLAEYDGNMRIYPINNNPYGYTGGTVKSFPGLGGVLFHKALLVQIVRDDTASELHFEWSQDGGETWARLYTVAAIAATHAGIAVYGADTTGEQNSKPHVYTFEMFDDT
jgi:hypothetical protein